MCTKDARRSSDHLSVSQPLHTRSLHIARQTSFVASENLQTNRWLRFKSLFQGETISKDSVARGPNRRKGLRKILMLEFVKLHDWLFASALTEPFLRTTGSRVFLWNVEHTWGFRDGRWWQERNGRAQVLITRIRQTSPQYHHPLPLQCPCFTTLGRGKQDWQERNDVPLNSPWFTLPIRTASPFGFCGTSKAAR